MVGRRRQFGHSAHAAESEGKRFWLGRSATSASVRHDLGSFSGGFGLRGMFAEEFAQSVRDKSGTFPTANGSWVGGEHLHGGGVKVGDQFAWKSDGQDGVVAAHRGSSYRFRRR